MNPCNTYSFFSFFFFLMIRRPPRSTLFPTRRSSDLMTTTNALELRRALGRVLEKLERDGRPILIEKRSEEHTSELQSQSNLVCRLLLEKKKKKKYTDQAIKRIKNRKII